VNTTKTLKVGDAAPDFELPTKDKQVIRLSDYRGRKNVVLLFYPLAWTPV
jgi:peroxiredoxin